MLKIYPLMVEVAQRAGTASVDHSSHGLLVGWTPGTSSTNASGSAVYGCSYTAAVGKNTLQAMFHHVSVGSCGPPTVNVLHHHTWFTWKLAYALYFSRWKDSNNCTVTFKQPFIRCALICCYVPQVFHTTQKLGLVAVTLHKVYHLPRHTTRLAT